MKKITAKELARLFDEHPEAKEAYRRVFERRLGDATCICGGVETFPDEEGRRCCGYCGYPISMTQDLLEHEATEAALAAAVKAQN